MTESNLGKLCHDERQKHTFGGPQSSFLTAGGSGSIPTHFVIPKRYNQTFSCQTNRLKGHAVAGEELCSGERNAAIYHQSGKVQTLRSCQYGYLPVWGILKKSR